MLLDNTRSSRRRGREIALEPTEKQVAYLAQLIGSKEDALRLASKLSRKEFSQKISEINFIIAGGKR